MKRIAVRQGKGRGGKGDVGMSCDGLLEGKEYGQRQKG